MRLLRHQHPPIFSVITLTKTKKTDYMASDTKTKS